MRTRRARLLTFIAVAPFGGARDQGVVVCVHESCMNARWESGLRYIDLRRAVLPFPLNP